MDTATLSNRTRCGEEWLRQEVGRLYAYQILHAIYSYPSLETLNFLKYFVWSKKHREKIRSFGLDAYQSFWSLLDLFNQDATHLLNDLEIEYTRLFINSFNGVPVKPYESVYLSDGHMVSGESTVNVKAFYQAFGVSPMDNYPEPPDHMAIETEFMTHLIIKELHAFEQGDIRRGERFRNGQIRFLQQHLLCWAWHFSDLVHMHSQHPFYHDAGLFSKNFFNVERKMVGL